jgi:hypothetical protein
MGSLTSAASAKSLADAGGNILASSPSLPPRPLSRRSMLVKSSMAPSYSFRAAVMRCRGKSSSSSIVVVARCCWPVGGGMGYLTFGL